MYEYENFRRISYEGGAMFVPVCPNCGRFVKADDSVMVNDWLGLAQQQNATCSKCGRVEMPFEGFFDIDETEHITALDTSPQGTSRQRLSGSRQ